MSYLGPIRFFSPLFWQFWPTILCAAGETSHRRTSWCKYKQRVCSETLWFCLALLKFPASGARLRVQSALRRQNSVSQPHAAGCAVWAAASTASKKQEVCDSERTPSVSLLKEAGSVTSYRALLRTIQEWKWLLFRIVFSAFEQDSDFFLLFKGFFFFIDLMCFEVGGYTGLLNIS